MVQCVRMVTTYQLHYSPETKAKCSPSSQLVDTRAVQTALFESYWMATLPIPSDGFTAVLSPEFERKTGKRIENITAIIQRRPDVQIWMPSNARLVQDNNIWYSAERWHPGIVARAAVALHTAGIDVRVMTQPTYMLYCNYFWMQGPQWKIFRNGWLIPVINAMESSIFTDPCTHKSGSGHTRQRLQEATGYPHYTWKPFICERLIGTFAYQNKLKIGYF